MKISLTFLKPLGSLLFTMLMGLYAFAQPDMYFHHLSVQDGLSQSTIYSIIQDKEGFIWVGTRDGLNRYDGYQFNTYRNARNDSSALSNNRVFELIEDTQGNLWVGTDNGLNLYNREFDNFKQFHHFSDVENSHIYALFQDAVGRIWIGTDGGGVAYFDTEAGFFKSLSKLFKSNGFDPNIRVRSILEPLPGEVWIATKGHGIYIYNYKTNTLSNNTERYFQDKLLSNSIRTLFYDSNNNIWIGYDEEGLSKVNMVKNEMLHFTSKQKNGISHNAVRKIYQDSKGTLWVGTRVGLNKYHPNTHSFTHYLHDDYRKGSLSNNSIRSVLEDDGGNMWVGTYYGGLNIAYSSSGNFSTYAPNPHKKNSLSYEVVSSFAQDNKGNIWVGTEGGGINKFLTSTDGFKALQHNPSNPNSLSNNNVKSLFYSQGKLYIGTYGGGLSVYDLSTQQFKNYRSVPGDSTSLTSDNIYSIFKDSNGRFWVGTNLGGLNVFHPESNTFSKVDPLNAQGDKLLGHTINCIVEDSDANLWLGSDKSLVKYSHSGYKPMVLLEGENYENSEVNILSLKIDSKNNLWVGTEGNGLIHVEIKTGKTTRYSKKQGLSSNIIYGIQEDDNTCLWISTNKGLLKFPLSVHYGRGTDENQDIVQYDINDGLQGDEFNRGASFNDASGKLYFGGLKGFSCFQPANISTNKTIPPVEITGFYLSNKKVEEYGKNSPLEKHISQTQSITLTYKQSSFSFDFVALNYDKPQKNQYAYKLEGFDKDWIYSGKNHTAVYTNIDPGEYIFKVKASNNDNLWNPDGASVHIKVLPPFWKTKWAFLIYLMVIGLLMLAFRRLIIARTNQKNLLENERLEKRRIEELNQMKLRFFTNISHEFRTPLTLISGPVEKLRQANTINQGEKEYLIDLVHKNVNRLQRLISQLMDFRKLENRRMKLGVAPDNLYDFVKQVIQVFEEFCRQRNIELSVITKTQSNKTVWFDKNVVDNIIFILMSNATKFTPENGKIEIGVNVFDDVAEIYVKDTGIGISKEKLGIIFERFYSESSLSYAKGMGTGIGLSFAKSLIELHKGKINVQSEEGKGTTFSFAFPPNQESYDEGEIKDTRECVDAPNKKVVAEVIPSTRESDTSTCSETLLIVEDNRELSAFIKGHFQSKFRVFEAENGKEAFKLAKKHMPDVIVSDVMMPVMNGIDFCKSVKNNLITSHIPVILLTAKTETEHKIEGAQSGADIYIEKPFNIGLLEANVNNLLLQRKALRERFAGQIESENASEVLHKVEDEFITKAKAIIDEKKNDPELTVEYLGEVLGLSRSQLFRKFKALTNYTPNEFIKVVRLKYAVELMIAGELNINQISYECGFSSASHFIASFKKHYHKTPKEYATLIAQKNKGKISY